MDLGIAIILFLLGLIIGSFLNSVIYRFDEINTLFTHRSHCPHCKAEIAWYDLVPLFSFVALSGRCRSCRKQISWQYPIVELITGLLFAAIYLNFSISIYSIFLLFASCFLLVIFVYDLYHMIIPDLCIVPPLIVWIVLWLLTFTNITLNLPASFSNLLLGAIISAGFIGLLVLITRGKGMGIGDIKLALLVGFILGWPNIVIGLSLAFIIGAIVGLMLLISKTKKLKSSIPFGPFLVIGFYIALFWGPEIIKWYLK